jgi:hypothetical protein
MSMGWLENETRVLPGNLKIALAVLMLEAKR